MVNVYQRPPIVAQGVLDMYNTLHYLAVESVDLRNHPLTNDTAKNRKSYYLALSYIVQKTVADHQIEIAADTKEYISKRLELYCESLEQILKQQTTRTKA